MDKKIETIREICDSITSAFDWPGQEGHIEGDGISVLIDEISPWQDEIMEAVKSVQDEDKFRKFWLALKVSFGFGYALGQMLDVPEIDITPIEELLREKKTILYLPHKKKAA